MNKTTIGLLIIFFGVCYGSLAIDSIYDRTLGLLIKYKLIKLPPAGSISPSILGQKGQVVLYASILIIIGLYLIWNRNN